MSHNKNNKNKQHKKTIVTIDENVLDNIPDNAVLFGGHPNWQKHFYKKFPSCKIIPPDSVNFPLNVITKASCILLNSRHMSHSQWYRFMPAIKKHNKKIIYIK